MISRTDALRLTDEKFPAGPEALAVLLGIRVKHSPMTGVEGWCIRGINTVLRINSNSSSYRQRFTLAHELAHLVLGTEPDIASEPFRSDNQEERDADQLASEFLIPIDQLNRYLKGQLPIDAKLLKRIAKAANVSPVMSACRVVSCTEELGIQNAAVVFFQENKEAWRYSHGLRFDNNAAQQLFHQAMLIKPNLVREDNADGNVVVGSIIDAQIYQVLLIQLLPKQSAIQETEEERIRRLSQKIFGNDRNFQQSVAATLGAVKQNSAGKSFEEALAIYFEKYVGKKYSGHIADLLRSAEGREYLALYLQRWFQ